jgi:hypothetical protein
MHDFYAFFQLHPSSDDVEDLAMKIFFATLHDDARRWYDGLPDKGIKTMDQFERTFLNEWSLYKRFPTLNIRGYPNHFPLGLVDNCLKFDGNPSMAKSHVAEFLKYISKEKVRHHDVLVRLFLLSLGADQREWVKHDVIPKSIISIRAFILIFLDRWDPTMRVYKNTSTLKKEGLHPSPINEDQNQQEVEERVIDEGYKSHEEEQEFTTKDNEDQVEEKEPEDIKHDEVLMCAPHSDEAIPNPFPPAQEEEDEVSHFPFQVFDDTLFYDLEGEEEREPLDELDPPYYEVERASHKDEAPMLTPPFDKVIQVFKAPAQEVNTVSCFPFQHFDDALFRG